MGVLQSGGELSNKGGRVDRNQHHETASNVKFVNATQKVDPLVLQADPDELVSEGSGISPI
jgi:hypothetical protein